MGLAEPLMDAVQHSPDPFGGHVGCFPGRDLLAKDRVERCLRGDAEVRTNLSEPLVLRGQEASPVLATQVQQDGVGQVEPVCVCQLNSRHGSGRVQFEHGDGNGREQQEFLCPAVEQSRDVAEAVTGTVENSKSFCVAT
jgi:hypothetical protein